MSQSTLLETIQRPETLRMADRVDSALRASGYGPLRVIKVRVETRLVILEGRVPSFHLKQIAQAIAMTIPGVQQVLNNLEVVGPR